MDHTSLGCAVEIALIVYFAVAIVSIAQKLQEGPVFWAFIPIANLFFMVGMASRPWWWGLLLMVPILNIVIWAIVWMDIAVRRGKPGWVGFLMIVPGVNLIALGYLAFSS